jgi:hypothetical protein
MIRQVRMQDRGWFTSSRSSNNAACVEVRFAGGQVDVRLPLHHLDHLRHRPQAQVALDRMRSI